MAVKALERQKAKGKVIEARPTLIVVPSSLHVQTVDEARKNFGTELNFLSFYSNVANLGQDDPRKDITITTTELDDRMSIRNMANKHPATTATVVVTTYETLKKRWIKSYADKWDSSRHDGPWAIDKVVPRVGFHGSGVGDNRAGNSEVDEDEDEIEDDEFELEDYEGGQQRQARVWRLCFLHLDSAASFSFLLQISVTCLPTVACRGPCPWGGFKFTR
jgi:SNF2 family DNA or RNA helicase